MGQSPSRFPKQQSGRPKPSPALRERVAEGRVRAHVHKTPLIKRQPPHPSPLPRNGGEGVKEQIPIQSLTLAVFQTSLGWIGAVGRGKRLVGLTVGHPSAMSARMAALNQIETWESGALDEETDWCPQLKKKLVDYALGKKVRFDDIPLEMPKLTEFQSHVLDQTRKIGYGEKLSYGELALRAGYPRAARGVGTVMSKNRFPVIIPCHRVIARGGALQGYAGGLELKARLLVMEGAVPAREPAQARLF